jgi:hypothetical protein
LTGRNNPAGHFGLTDEFSAQFEADPPSELALAGMPRREDEGEFRGNFGIVGNHLDAAVRDVRDGAVARQRAGPELDFREPFAKLTFASTSIHQHVDPSPLFDHASSGIPATFTEQLLVSV